MSPAVLVRRVPWRPRCLNSPPSANKLKVHSAGADGRKPPSGARAVRAIEHVVNCIRMRAPCVCMAGGVELKDGKRKWVWGRSVPLSHSCCHQVNNVCHPLLLPRFPLAPLPSQVKCSGGSTARERIQARSWRAAGKQLGSSRAGASGKGLEGRGAHATLRGLGLGGLPYMVVVCGIGRGGVARGEWFRNGAPRNYWVFGRPAGLGG